MLAGLRQRMPLQAMPAHVGVAAATFAHVCGQNGARRCQPLFRPVLHSISRARASCAGASVGRGVHGGRRGGQLGRGDHGGVGVPGPLPHPAEQGHRRCAEAAWHAVHSSTSASAASIEEQCSALLYSAPCIISCGSSHCLPLLHAWTLEQQGHGATDFASLQRQRPPRAPCHVMPCRSMPLISQCAA